MAEDSKCSECGRLMPAGSVGVCPQCLLGMGLLNHPEATTQAAPAQQPAVGDRIDRYKLLEKIGEGGCGVVYMAEQHEPVRRRVALKVIKLGMDTSEVIARFEAERQALAVMEHPNIARVFDGGATVTGRPYFVMELVRGVRITDYCDQHKLATGQRLELFQQVCHAVQHAHQKGIIHRDLKPSNILVTVNDGVPVPKVIDFGIAKATGPRLTDKTIFTRFLQFIGTPAYMSPEQAEFTSVDIDTRTDIYALGVLLYELLVGKTPFDSSELQQSGLDEMRRIIREQEPVRPSTRLSTMIAGELTTTAQRRRASAPELIHLLKGDLDWIVMKCLEKDRSRRYDTANALAADIQRHLKNEPVLARPASNLYRLKKLVRRNRLVFGAAAGIAAALLTGIIVSTWQAARATHAEREQRRLGDVANTTIEEWRDAKHREINDLWNGSNQSVPIDSITRSKLWGTTSAPEIGASPPQHYVIGVYAHEPPLLTAAQFVPLLVYLENSISSNLATTVRLDLHIYKSNGSARDALVAGQVDIMRIASGPYVKARLENPLVTPLVRQMPHEYNGVVFVHTNSGIYSMDDMARKSKALSFAFGDVYSTMSGFYGKAFLVKHGIRAADLKTNYHHANHPLVLSNVWNRAFDAGLAKETLFNKFRNQHGAALRVIGTFQAASFPWAASGNAPAAFVDAFKQSLLALNTNSHPHILDKLPDNATGFAPTTDSDFDPVRAEATRAEQFNESPAGSASSVESK